MESKYLFYVAVNSCGYGTPYTTMEAFDLQEAACHRLRARIKSGTTLVRVEVKRKQD